MFKKLVRAKTYLKYKYSIYSSRIKFAKILQTIKNPIFIDGHPDSKNFGDALNIFLVEYLSEMTVFPSKYIGGSKYKSSISYSVIGSICQWTNNHSVVWGSGFISSIYSSQKFVKPSVVNAVRGPLTREIYLNNNVYCPEVYGDPALLMPLIFDPLVEKKYKFGIIPHYTDKDNKWIKNQNDDVLTIDIEIFDDYQKFISELKSCEKIITSSLHGLILAHAYKIPVCWVSFSENITGGNFKFQDYLASVNKRKDCSIFITENIDIHELKFDNDEISIDLRPLIEKCPFATDNKKQFLLSRL